MCECLCMYVHVFVCVRVFYMCVCVYLDIYQRTTRKIIRMFDVPGSTPGQCICRCPDASISGAKRRLSTLCTTGIYLMYVVYTNL